MGYMWILEDMQAWNRNKENTEKALKCNSLEYIITANQYNLDPNEEWMGQYMEGIQE